MIEKMLGDAAAKGELTALTLWPASGGMWQCNARWRSGGWTCVTSPDPVDGARRALEGKSSPTPVDPEILI